MLMVGSILESCTLSGFLVLQEGQRVHCRILRTQLFLLWE
jgi:hypothetical protein